MKFEKNILCIGAGYVGGPTMAVIAKHCPTYKVNVVDVDADKIRRWNSGDLPIYEPGLKEVVASQRGKNLFFGEDVASGIREADIIFVSVNTPTKTFGQGAGKAANLQYWEKTAREIVEYSDKGKIVVEKSTLPVRTAEAMERILQSNKQGLQFEILSNPEFLAEGTAIQDLEEPDRVLVGSRQTEAGIRARGELVDLYTHWVPKDKILTTDIWSSELSKLSANAFLAQRISSINAISALCEKTQADVTAVARAIGTDRRIGEHFLRASVGFGGSCFKKDILNLVYLCQYYGLEDVAKYWESVVRMNVYQEHRFVEKMVECMFNTVAGKRIALFGFAFKANTGDTRESPAICVAKRLLEEHAHLAISDPKALSNARHDLAAIEGEIEFQEDPYAAAEGAHAIAVLTEWEVYRHLDYAKMYDTMQKPAFIFDGRNILDHEALFDIGFNVYPLGRPAIEHF